MLKHLAVLAAFVSLFSIAGANAEVMSMESVNDAKVMGNWISRKPGFSNSVMQIYMSLNFADSENVTVASVCRFKGGKVLEASITVPVIVENGQITITGTGENEVEDSGQTCRISIDEAGKSVNYSFVGAFLRLSADGHVFDFQRRK